MPAREISRIRMCAYRILTNSNAAGSISISTVACAGGRKIYTVIRQGIEIQHRRNTASYLPRKV